MGWVIGGIVYILIVLSFWCLCIAAGRDEKK
jgi:hypothetical protein